MGRWPGKEPTPLDVRFWAKVDKSGECWTWTAYTDRYDYGVIIDGKRSELAHRVSWRLNVGPIPDGMCVLHRCDNPPCVNPAHLFLGTRGDNNRDRENKGRGGEKKRRGEGNGRAKLTRKQVEAMREVYRAGGVSQAQLAELYGVSSASISFALNGVTWKGD